MHDMATNDNGDMKRVEEGDPYHRLVPLVQRLCRAMTKADRDARISARKIRELRTVALGLEDALSDLAQIKRALFMATHDGGIMDDDQHIRQLASVASSQPFAFGVHRALNALISHCRMHPRCFADIVAFSQYQDEHALCSGVIRLKSIETQQRLYQTRRALAYAIVVDIFPQNYHQQGGNIDGGREDSDTIFQDCERSCLSFVSGVMDTWNVLEQRGNMKRRQQQSRSKKGGTTTPLDRQSLPFYLVEMYFQDRGSSYLLHTLGPVVNEIIACKWNLHEAVQLVHRISEEADGSNDFVASVVSAPSTSATIDKHGRATAVHNAQQDIVEESRALPPVSEQRKAATKLMYLCSRILDQLLDSLSNVPIGIRYLAKVAVGYETDALDDGLRVTAIVGDLFFLNFVVKAVLFPDVYGIVGVVPISEHSRRNLQTVGSVLIKIVTGSQFAFLGMQGTADDTGDGAGRDGTQEPEAKSGPCQMRLELNAFIDIAHQRMQRFCGRFVCTAYRDLRSSTEDRVCDANEVVISKISPLRRSSRSLLTPLCMKAGDLVTIQNVIRGWYGGRHSDCSDDASGNESGSCGEAQGLVRALSQSGMTAEEIGLLSRRSIQYSVIRMLSSNVDRDHRGPLSVDDAASDVYVTLTAGVPSLDKRDEETSQNTSSKLGWPLLSSNAFDCAVALVRRCVAALSPSDVRVRDNTTIGCDIDVDKNELGGAFIGEKERKNSDSCLQPLSQVLLDATERLRANGRESSALVVAECIASLKHIIMCDFLSEEWTCDNLVPLLTHILDMDCNRSVDGGILRVAVAELLTCEYLIKEGTRYVRSSRALALKSYETIQIRHYLRKALPTIGAFEDFMHQRMFEPLHTSVPSLPTEDVSELRKMKKRIGGGKKASNLAESVHFSQSHPVMQKNKRVPESFLCGGPCPASPKDDCFVCARCLEYLTKCASLISQFTEKYCLARPSRGATRNNDARVHSGRVMIAELDTTQPHVIQQVKEYVVHALYSQLFRQCKKSDKVWQSSMDALNKYFSSYVAFYVFMSEKRAGKLDKFGSFDGAGARPPPVMAMPQDGDSGTASYPAHDVNSYFLALCKDESVIEQAKMVANQAVRQWRADLSSGSLVVPLLGQETERAIVSILQRVDAKHSAAEKIVCLEKCVNMLLTVFSSPPLNVVQINSFLKNPESCVDSGSGSSRAGHTTRYGITADHLMIGLSYSIMRANPMWILSNVQIMQTLFQDRCGGNKAFVDVLVSLRMLASLRDGLLHILPPTPIETARSEHAAPRNIVLLHASDRMCMKLKWLRLPSIAIHMALRAAPADMLEDDVHGFLWCVSFVRRIVEVERRARLQPMG